MVIVPLDRRLQGDKKSFRPLLDSGSHPLYDMVRFLTTPHFGKSDRKPYKMKQRDERLLIGECDLEESPCDTHLTN